MNRTLPALALLSALATGAAMTATPAAAADGGVKLGVLTCKVADVDNVVVYTKQTFACEFDPIEGPNEAYTGQITKIGIDLSIKTDFTIVWAVMAPTDSVYKPHALEGTYAGVGADIALGAAAGAKVLVGGGDDSFSLQPVSVAGVEGGGASIGIEKFTLG